MMEQIVFSGPLSALCERFIAYKHSVGCKYSREEYCLMQFDKFMLEHAPYSDHLSKDLVLEWTARRSYETATNQQFRISVIRQFGKYLDSQGFQAYIHPICYNSSGPKHRPYVFTEEEIQRIFFAADHMQFSKNSPYRHITTPIIIKTLYGCGLRITEALNLKIEDLDKKSHSLIIKNSKFGKSRIVPMSDSLWSIYEKFILEHRSNAQDTEFLFPDQLTAHGFYGRFRDILCRARISHRGKGKGPRLHDIRHTFAVHCLNRWHQQGVDVYAMLPILSEYLGHNSISATSDYLRLTPASFGEIISMASRTHPLYRQGDS